MFCMLLTGEHAYFYGLPGSYCVFPSSCNFCLQERRLCEPIKAQNSKKIGTDHHSFIISGVDVTKDWCLVHCSFCCLYLMLFSVYVHTPPGQPHDQWSVINYHHLLFSARKKMDTMRQPKQNVNKTKRAMGDKGKQTLQSLYSATRSCSYFGWSCIIIVYCSIIATYSQET